MKRVLFVSQTQALEVHQQRIGLIGWIIGHRCGMKFPTEGYGFGKMLGKEVLTSIPLVQSGGELRELTSQQTVAKQCIAMMSGRLFKCRIG